MVAALASPLAERGARVGVLMGTAYVFTLEAVEGGAIQPFFQQAVCEGRSTVLLETSPGHSVRALDTPYIGQFHDTKKRLQDTGATTQEVWAALEELNLGRLRIASKALVRDAGGLRNVEAEEAYRDGMFMIGDVAMLRDAPTRIAALHRDVSEGSSAWLRAQLGDEAQDAQAEPLDIAVIGMGACFPDASDVDGFWSNVVHGVDSIREIPDERWKIADYYDPRAVTQLAGVKTPSKWGGFLPEVAFDALAYGIPPRSLASIEPTQLLALEVARRALADAGYADREFDRSRVSVIFGAEAGTDLSSAYGLRSLFTQYCGEMPEALDRVLPKLTEDSFPGMLTNVIAGRIANRLDLGGSNFTVDAACASGLAALDQACKELASGESDMVLCGAADLHNGINDYLLFSSVHALSPKGRCATFDSDADGIVLGEGVACVALKRRADAERDGDRIYAVISGFGGSSDGRCLGLTAPRPEGQKRALERAYRQAGISPAEIGLLEAHGTGTVVGDRTELEAVTDLYRRSGAEPGSCAIGSVKSQIGHTKCAAGLAGMIKAALALHTGVRPPTLHIRQPNEAYKSETSPFHFSVSPRPWIGAGRRAAVSAFGFGGSNFHVVLSAYEGEEAPRRGLRHWPTELVLLRAADREAAQAEIARVEKLLDRHDAAGQPWRLRDLAFTISTSSSAPVQIAIVAADLADLRAKLGAARAFEASDGVHVRNAVDGKLAFLFPGQGSQRPGMLADLFAAFPQLQRLLELGEPWLDALYPPAAFSGTERSAQQKALTDTRVAQPALGIVDLAMAEVLTELGVQPDALAGHSYGELVALCVAGAFGEHELIELSSERAHAILAAAGDDPGSMAAVEASAAEVEAALAGMTDVVLANDNAPRQIVISGPTPAIERALEKLQQSSLSASRIPVACAFHSPVVHGAAERLAKRLSEIDVADLELPVWSNTSGRLYPAEAAAVAELLAQQVARPVRFREEIEGMYADGVRIFVETGPGRVLTNLVKKILGARPHVAVHCDASGEPGLPSLLRAAAQLAVCGVELSMQALYGDRECRRIEERDLAALRPHFRVDGYTVRTADGNVIQGALQPASTLTPVQLAAAPAAAPVASAGEREATVQSYLRGMRELVLAQREVMLSYLGTPVPAFDTTATAWRESAPAVAELPAAARPAPAPTAAAAPAPAAPSKILQGDELMQAVLGIVSERTGYPGEMLEPDLDLEADLSIDSIKRMEILAELTERVQLPAAKGAEVDEGVIEELARLKTLRQIVAWIDARTGAAPAAAAEPAPAPDRAPAAVAAKPEPEPVQTQASEATPAPEAAVRLPERARRYRFELVELEPLALSDTALAGRMISFSGGGHELRRAFAEAVHAAGGVAREWKPGLELGESDAMLHLAALPSEDRSASLPRLFAELRETALRGCPTILVITGLGGSFGLAGGALVQAEAWAGAAGVAGLVRTFAREFPEQRLRAVDLDLKDDPRRLAQQLVAELAATTGPVEVGYAGGRRQTLRLAAADLQPAGTAARILDADSVVLVTGGARGIGARTSLALARQFGCHVEMVGRSPLPDGDEPVEIAQAADAPALRKALIARGERKPAAIEAECARILAAREIRSALAGLAAHAASVTYHALDARDGAALGALVQDVYARRGRLDAVIHAAGILEDKLIRDKTFESFQRVFDTKVAALQTLARALHPDLKFLVCFGSIAGALGNRGQVDYAAANAALALHSRRLNGSLGGRVVTIAWGPWAGGGMVTPELEREYQRRGMGLIQPDDGIQCLLDELASGSPEDAEVVVMRAEV
jgi:acyl transferase domain-containing protein